MVTGHFLKVVAPQPSTIADMMSSRSAFHNDPLLSYLLMSYFNVLEYSVVIF